MFCKEQTFKSSMTNWIVLSSSLNQIIVAWMSWEQMTRFLLIIFCDTLFFSFIFAILPLTAIFSSISLLVHLPV